MSVRFLKFIPSDEALFLMRYHPNAFILLTYIANSARRYSGHPDGLSVGQCHLQSWKEYGLTEQQYRTAKKILVTRKHIAILLTNRFRKNATTVVTTNSTLVQLCNDTIYDINPEQINDLINDRPTTDQRPTNDKQERRRMNKKEKEEEKIAPSDQRKTANRLRAVDALSFDFEQWCYIGISDQDLATWKELYPNVDVASEILKSAEWVKANPSRRKKLWRSFLMRWFQKAESWNHNKKAFQATSSTNQVDRRTKDINGKPVENQYAGRF